MGEVTRCTNKNNAAGEEEGRARQRVLFPQSQIPVSESDSTCSGGRMMRGVDGESEELTGDIQ